MVNDKALGSQIRKRILAKSIFSGICCFCGKNDGSALS
jgi:hypothetical protein